MAYSIDKELKHYASRMHHSSTYRINKKGKPERPNNELNRWSNTIASYYISETREVVIEDEPNWDYYWTTGQGYWRISEDRLILEILSKDVWDSVNPLGRIWVDYSKSHFKTLQESYLCRTLTMNYIGTNLDYFDMITRAEAKLVLRELIN